MAVILAIILGAAGTFLIWREVRRGRPVSRAALAGDVLAVAGAGYGTVLTACGPLWPLALATGPCALGMAVATVRLLGARWKGLGR